jgi:hypothetical protein
LALGNVDVLHKKIIALATAVKSKGGTMKWNL